MKITFLILASILITSCSCYNVQVTSSGEMPTDLLIGEKVRTTIQLYGSLEEFVDDPNVHYIYLNQGQTAKKRYVLEQFIIPAGTEFFVAGYTKPRNPLCSNDKVNVLLKPHKQLSLEHANAHVKIDMILDGKLFERVSAAGLTSPRALRR